MTNVAPERVDQLADLVRFHTGIPLEHAREAVVWAFANDLPVWPTLPEIYPPAPRSWWQRRRAARCSHALLPYEAVGWVCSTCGTRVGVLEAERDDLTNVPGLAAGLGQVLAERRDDDA